jgi:inorganic triphosphatase YgiF
VTDRETLSLRNRDREGEDDRPHAGRASRANANREVELKLLPLGGMLRDIGRAAVRAGAKRSGRPRKIRSIYFDTGDFSLRDSGYNLRIRHNKPGNIQTVKTTKPDAAVFGRGECFRGYSAGRRIGSSSDPFSRWRSIARSI